MESAPPTRILFIGDSLTSHRGKALDATFRMWGYDAAAKTMGGATLTDIWKRAGPAFAQAIQKGAYDYVVLQEDLPEYYGGGEKVVEPFRSAVANFVKCIKEANAVPILYMAHGYERLSRTSYEDICSAHHQVSRQLGVAVAPGAVAHQIANARAASLDLSLQLLEPDDEHPSDAGLYLHALTIGLTISEMAQHGGSTSEQGAGEELADLQALFPWVPTTIDDATVSFLHDAALEATKEWRRLYRIQSLRLDPAVRWSNSRKLR